jgi:DnaJ-class molecular chaperone
MAKYKRCKGNRFEQVSKTCPTCGGDGEIAQGGTVEPCTNPFCYWGSIQATEICSRCKGTGEEPRR